MSSMFKTECPACGQHIEAPDELARTGLKCPACNTGFVPKNPKPDKGPSFAPPLPAPLKDKVAALRAQSAYPELRQLVDVVYWLGLLGLGLVAFVTIANGVATGQDTSKSDLGIGVIWSGIGLAILAALWWKLFRPLASLTIDVADALIEIARKR